MSHTEERLVAALEARAGLIQLEDLAPLQVPEPPGRSWPGPVVMLAVAATAAVVVALPFLLHDGDDPGGRPPAVSPTPSPTALPSLRGVGVTESDRQRVDVDGDGHADTVRLMGRSDQEGWTDLGYVEVRTAGGVTRQVDVPDGYLSELKPALDIDGDGRKQVWFTWSGGGESFEVEIYHWNDGRLVQLELPHDQPAADGFGAGTEGAPRTGFYAAAGDLFTFAALDQNAGTQFQARLWKWRIEGHSLASTSAGEGCVETSEGEYSPCG